MGVGGAPPSGKGVTREGSLANEGTSLSGRSWFLALVFVGQCEVLVCL